VHAARNIAQTDSPLPSKLGAGFRCTRGIISGAAADAILLCPDPKTDLGTPVYRASRYNAAKGPWFRSRTTRDATMPDATPSSAMSVDDCLLLAGITLQEARLADALAALHQAELLDPEDPLVHLGLGGAYLHDRRYAQAVTHLERAIALDPDIALAHYNLGMALQYLGRSGAAIAALRQAVALDATLADAHARLGDLLEQHHGPGPEAIACFRAAAAAAPGTTLGRLSHAKVLIAEQRRDEAEACLRQAIALDPASGPALCGWAPC
jgi:tetratricopeptide (TPR) repeat protein